MEKKGNIGWAFLGFFLPLVGLILYLVWKDSNIENANMAGKGALIGVVVEVVLGIGLFFLTSCAINSFVSTAMSNF